MKTTESFLLNQLQMIQLHDIEPLGNPSKERRDNMAKNLSTSEQINQFRSLSQFFYRSFWHFWQTNPVHVAFNPIYFVFEKHLSSRNQISEGKEKKQQAQEMANYSTAIAELHGQRWDARGSDD